MSNTESSLTLAVAVRDFIVSRKLANLSPRTVAWYQEKLGRLLRGLEDLPLEEMTLDLFRDRVAERAKEVKASTVNHHIRAFKALIRWLVEEEYPVTLNPQRIKLIKTEHRLPPVLSLEQIQAILSQPDQGTWAGMRDHCLISLLVDTGIRISECLGLKVEKVQGVEGIVAVVGKGNKEREVATSVVMRRLLRKWLRMRRSGLETGGMDEGFVFPARSGARLGYRWIARRIRQYGRAAGITDVRVSPHTFRSSFATHFCKEGGSIVHLQSILGHTSLEMSRRYAVAADQDAFESSRRLSPFAAIQKGQSEHRW